MSFSFHAGEILEMAVEIERNGVVFYRAAAEALMDRELRVILEALAVMEEDHQKTFARMKEDLLKEHGEFLAFDPQDEGSLYLRAMVDGHVFDSRMDPVAWISGKRPKEILRMAIELEKDSIVFYLGLKDIAQAHLGQGRVEEIIREEMGHIAQLADQLAHQDLE